MIALKALKNHGSSFCDMVAGSMCDMAALEDRCDMFSKTTPISITSYFVNKQSQSIIFPPKKILKYRTCNLKVQAKTTPPIA